MAELELLCCHACNAPLVLGDTDTVACASCGASTPVPDAYRDLFRARHADVALRADAERVLRRLARPANIVVKVLARVLDQGMFAFVVFYGVPATIQGVLLETKVELWLKPRLHLPRGEDVPFSVFLAAVCGYLFVIAFIPRALGVYANRRATGRARLLAALRAHPPDVKGGPSTCRSCGAPLTIAQNAIVATCMYCGAENAVELEAGVVVATKQEAETLGKTIAEVAAHDRAQRRATLWLLAKELGRYALRTVLLGAGFYLGGEYGGTVGILSVCATLALFVVFLIRSTNARAAADAADRRSGNDVPSWVGIVGPIVLLVILSQVGWVWPTVVVVALYVYTRIRPPKPALGEA